MGNLTQVLVPDIGDFKDVDVIEVLVSPGDAVSEEDPLITLESDKATMEVPSTAGGVVRELLVGVGDKVSEGTPILALEASATAPDTTAPAEPPPATPEPEPATPPPAATAAGTAPVQVRVPDIGDFSDVDIIEVMVKPGDVIAAEDLLITLESDKATMDVPASHGGLVVDVAVSVGDKVSEGSVIATVQPEADAAADAMPKASTPAAAPPETPRPEPAAPSPATGSRDTTTAPPPSLPPPVERAGVAAPHASPSIRRFARELGADLTQVRGSGPKGRILKEDVQAFVKSRLTRAPEPEAPAGGAGIPPLPEVDFARFGPVETRELPRIKRISGPHLHRAWLNVPMVTHHDEADITELEAFRKSLKDEAARRGVRVTALAFIMKAVAAGLREFPDVNASLTPDGQSLVYKQYFHVGVAVDTPNGLVVPVFRDVDRKSVWDLAAEMGDMSARAREGKLGPAEMQGGCISISSLGGIGGTAFTPIVNAPEVAILGVTRARMQPVWDGSAFLPRLMLPLDLTYDHRVIDGAGAARFVAFLCQALGDLRRLLL